MNFLLGRFAQLVLVLIGVSIVVFALVRLTGDPAVILLGDAATPEAIAKLHVELGLDRPLYVQYGVFLQSIARGQFGDSLRYHEPALTLFLDRLPATLELATAAMALAFGVGLPLGILAAFRPQSPVDNVVRVLALLGQAIPGFYLGIVAIIVFGAQLHLLPTGGRGGVAHLVLPAVTLALYQIAIVARFARGGMLETLADEYIRTARGKGLSEVRVVVRHALRNALIPVITIFALQFGTVLSGAVVTETVFSWPGVGRLAVEAIFARDFPVVQAVVMVTAAMFIVVNMLADLLYVVVDPRLRVAE